MQYNEGETRTTVTTGGQMQDLFVMTKTFIQAITAGVAGFFLGLPTAMQVLFWLIIADTVTGVLAAVVADEISKKKSFNGFIKKTAIIVLSVVAQFLDNFISPTIGISNIGGMIASFFCINEFMSVVINCQKCGVPIPAVLMSALEKFRGSIKMAGEAATIAKIEEKEQFIEGVTNAAARTESGNVKIMVSAGDVVSVEKDKEKLAP